VGRSLVAAMSKAKRPQAKYYQRACPRSAHTLLWSLETGRAQDNTRQPDLESVQIDRTRFVTSTQMTLHHTQPTPFIPPPQVLKLRRGKYFTGVSSVFIFLLRQRFFFFWCIFGFIDYPYGKFFRVCVCVCVWQPFLAHTLSSAKVVWFIFFGESGNTPEHEIHHHTCGEYMRITLFVSDEDSKRDTVSWRNRKSLYALAGEGHCN